MDVKLLDSLDYKEAAKVLVESYVPQWGVAGTPVWNAGYVEHLDKTFVKLNNGPYVGAFDGNKLIGVGMSAISTWKVAEVGEVKTANICNLGVLPAHQRKGVATNMVNELIKAVTGKVDLVYRICNEAIFDYLVLSKKCGFEKKINNANQMGRILGKDMVPKAVKFREYGMIMAQLVKTVAGLPKPEKKIQDGTFRDGTLDDIKGITEILTSYQDSVPLMKMYSESELKNFIENMSLLDGEKFSKIFKVWEKDGVIKAFVIGRFEPISYNAGELLMPIITDVGFASDLERKQKTSFMVTLILAIKEMEKASGSFATNVASAHLDEKAISKAGYNDDRSTRPLYAKLLNDDLKDWYATNWNKIKRYAILYLR